MTECKRTSADANPGPVGGHRVPAVRTLSIRLARLACDVHDTAEAIADEPLTEPDILLLAAPTAHLAIAVNTLEQVLDELETRGKTGLPPMPLTDAELREAA